MEQDLTGKVAIVTGAGRGRGKAVAMAIAAVGVRVAVNDQNPDRAEAAAAEIKANGGEAIAIAADVANKFQCVQLVEATRDAWGQIDILVNSAAILPRAPLLTMDEWDWVRCHDVNLKGVFFMTQLCARVMRDENRARGATIITLGDKVGVQVAAEQTAYSATMTGLIGFGRASSVALAAHGISAYTLLAENGRSADTLAALCTAVLSLCTGKKPTELQIESIELVS